jgi:NAD(P)-dependent dehydrogenase (short-subunit alcohol dehydrogenase family)
LAENDAETVLITGAGRRIGRAVALDLATSGWRVAIHYNTSGDDAKSAVAEVTEAGGQAVALAANLLDEEAASGLVARAADALGPVTCLINNASVFEEDTPMASSRETWDRHMDVNLRAPFLLSQGVARQLPEDAKGNIVNIIDQRVWNLTPEFTSYTVSKVGLWGLTRILARAFAPKLRVNAVGPGPTLQSVHQSEAEFEDEWSSLPLQTPVSTDDICRGVRFILDAPAMTGQMIALDGGQHMGWSQENERPVRPQ